MDKAKKKNEHKMKRDKVQLIVITTHPLFKSNSNLST